MSVDSAAEKFESKLTYSFCIWIISLTPTALGLVALTVRGYPSKQPVFRLAATTAFGDLNAATTCATIFVGVPTYRPRAGVVNA